MFKNERKFKEGAILTDGKGLIRIGYVLEKDWTPENNYGRKYNEYRSRTHYPKSGPSDPRGYYLNDELIYNGGSGNIPGLWFQDGYSLDKFRPIKENFIDPKILDKLKSLHKA